MERRIDVVSVIASIRVKTGKLSEFLPIFKANVPKVREERGCIEYFPALDIDAELGSEMPPQTVEPDVVTVIEKWKSVEALRDHLVAPHMQAYKKRVKDMIEDVVLKVLQEQEV
jgi:quinol monooxygenase YgiN